MAKKRNTTEITPLLGNHPIPISTLPPTRHATRKNTESAHPLNLLREEIQASFPPSPNSYSALRSAPPPHQSNCCSPLSAGSIGPTPRACLVQWYDLHKHASGNACPAPASGGGTALPQRVFSPPGDGYGGVVSDFGGVDAGGGDPRVVYLSRCQSMCCLGGHSWRRTCRTERARIGVLARCRIHTRGLVLYCIVLCVDCKIRHHVPAHRGIITWKVVNCQSVKS